VDLKRAILLKQVTNSCSFKSRAGYRLSLLALVQAIAWLREGSSIMSGDRKERERATVRKSGCWICGVAEEGDVLCSKAVAAMWVFP